MTRNILIIAAFVSYSTVGSTTAWSDEEQKVQEFLEQLSLAMAGKGEGGNFTGTKVCQACHMSNKIGGQYKIWKESPHAKAYQVLLTDEGIKRAAAKGIQNPQDDKNCLQCHSPITEVSTIYVGPKFEASEGVGCEACHGPGEKHSELQKEAVKNKTTAPAEAQEVLYKASDPVVREAMCARCHKEHEWHEMKSRDVNEAWEKIRHKKPKE